MSFPYHTEAGAYMLHLLGHEAASVYSMIASKCGETATWMVAKDRMLLELALDQSGMRVVNALLETGLISVGGQHAQQFSVHEVQTPHLRECCRMIAAIADFIDGDAWARKNWTYLLSTAWQHSHNTPWRIGASTVQKVFITQAKAVVLNGNVRLMPNGNTRSVDPKDMRTGDYCFTVGKDQADWQHPQPIIAHVGGPEIAKPASDWRAVEDTGAWTLRHLANWIVYIIQVSTGAPTTFTERNLIKHGLGDAVKTLWSKRHGFTPYHNANQEYCYYVQWLIQHEKFAPSAPMLYSSKTMDIYVAEQNKAAAVSARTAQDDPFNM